MGDCGSHTHGQRAKEKWLNHTVALNVPDTHVLLAKARHAAVSSVNAAHGGTTSYQAMLVGGVESSSREGAVNNQEQ